MKKLFGSQIIEQKPFDQRIKEATDIFRTTVNTLREITSEITEEVEENKERIAFLNEKNAELNKLQINSEKQIKAIEQLFV